MNLKFGLASLSLLCALSAAPISAQSTSYKFEREIPIGGEGGWDILTIDSAAHRLYLSHATKVVVVDLEKNAVAGEIADTPGVHAFRRGAGSRSRLFDQRQRNKASVVDLKTLKTIAKVDTGESPDAIALRRETWRGLRLQSPGKLRDRDRREELRKWWPRSRWAAAPEFAAADAAAGRVFVNLEDKSEVAAIDTAKHEVVARWPLAPGEEPTGIALDARIIGSSRTCDNKMMTMLDTQSGKVVGDRADRRTAWTAAL